MSNSPSAHELQEQLLRAMGTEAAAVVWAVAQTDGWPIAVGAYWPEVALFPVEGTPVYVACHGGEVRSDWRDSTPLAISSGWEELVLLQLDTDPLALESVTGAHPLDELLQLLDSATQ